MKRIAIVNRGEAAGRCIRAIKELRMREGSELTAIVLYTEPDRGAPFVRHADVALCLGPALRAARDGRMRPAYLDRPRILAALRASRADAVWPGWGFVAEDADFIEALEERGICFIGPPSGVIRAVGDKIAAKSLAERAGVPVAKWSGGQVSAENAAEFARDIGFPLMVKATAGGGGRGIRLVRDESELASALASAGAEAANAFGNDALYLEAVVDRPRHIEVQIAADQHGNVHSFGLRDCSAQRRNQKVIEESPPPGLAAATATTIENAAVSIARRAQYVGVGTVEFLLDRDTFYFLEVNPRLQVEHGITEMVSGCDLVATQIRIARGDTIEAPAPPRGHAIEARLCAEDAHAGFAPAPGTIALIDLPTGPGVRTDCSAAIGTVIPAEFDSLVAKIMAHGPDRAGALARLRAALGDLRLMVADGATTKGFLLNLLDSPDIRDGAVDIGWVDRNLARLTESRLAPQALIVAAILTYLRERAIQRLNFFVEASRGEPQSIPAASGHTVDLTFHGSVYTLHVLALGDWRYRIDLDERSCIAELLDQEAGACQLALGEARFTVEYADSTSLLQIEVDGQRHIVARDRGGEIRATAPSVVVNINVASGDRVVAGQRIGILETMKIEIALIAPISGHVQEVRAQPNHRVAAGDVLLVVQPEAGADDGNAPRVVLPEEDKAAPSFAEAYDEDRYVRERARQAVAHTVRRLLLGYDTEPDEVHDAREFFDAPLPPDLGQTILRELAEIRTSIEIFADTETLFSRQPRPTGDGGATRSNDAELRRYLRRVETAGTGIDPVFRGILEQTLRHYGVEGLEASEGLQRALLRLYAARRQRADRHRVIEAVLRHLGRLLQAGLELPQEPPVATSLGTCLVLRGDVPDALADAAAELRAAIFEAPEVERRTLMAAQAVDSALVQIDRDPDTELSRDLARSLADSAPPIFDTLIASSDPLNRRVLAIQAIVVRTYSPASLVRFEVVADTASPIVRLTMDNGHTALATLGRPDEVASAWPQLCAAADTDTVESVEVLLRADQPWNEDTLRAAADTLLGSRRPAATPVTFSAVTAGQPELAVSTQPNGRTLGSTTLHPATAKRIGLTRLAHFETRRLPAPRPLFAFLARSHEQAEDQRLFVYGEVHAAVPGIAGTLHEASFVRVFNDAARTLRRLRSDNPEWQRLHWNRLDLRVRPAFQLTPETLQRLVNELLPATRHLGLERILVRVELRENAEQPDTEERELVIEPASSGPPGVSWRPPHDTPLEPASTNARRIAAARRRGLIEPYEAIRSFTTGKHEGDRFIEYDLGADGTAQPIDRPIGENQAAVVIGVSVAHTEKYPEGLQRVTILSDPTRALAALTKAECDRIIAAMDLAEARQVPVEWFATSSGARISMDSGTENLDAVATVVRRIVRFTQADGEINVVVTGTNVGAQSYFDALSTMLMHTRGILVMTHAASMVLTGKRALEASGTVSAEDERAIGGFEDIMGPNGQAQYYARDLAEAFEILLRHYELTSPRPHVTTDHRARSITTEPCRAEDWSDAPAGATVGDYLAADSNPGRKKAFSIRPVMRALIDSDTDWLERWPVMRGAETAVVWDTHVGGHPICLIGIENRAITREGHAPPDGPTDWAGATLYPGSSKKIARSLNANSGSRAVVILANLAGFDGSPESMRELQLEYGAEIARAVVYFRGPILFVVTSRYHGGAYVVFSTRLNDGLRAIALKGSYASVIGGGPAATVIFGDRVQRQTDADPRVIELRQDLAKAESRFDKAAIRSQLATLQAEVHAEHHNAVAAEFDRIHSVERARDVGSLDEIIAAENLRQVVIERLDQARRDSA